MAKKILIMEDEEILSDLLMKKLQEEGYDVVLAPNGVQGLLLMKKQKPDLLLLDIVMPEMGGFEVMEEMNKEEGMSLKNIPVIIISNSGQPVEVDRALELGVRDYLIKAKFDPKEVVEKVRRQFEISKDS